MKKNYKLFIFVLFLLFPLISAVNPSSSVWKDLTNTDIGNWQSSTSVIRIFFNPFDNLTYTQNSGASSILASYNSTSNVWTNITSLNDWGTTGYINVGHYNDTLYIGTQGNCNNHATGCGMGDAYYNGKWYVYNITSKNATEKPRWHWETSPVQIAVYSPYDNLTYLGGGKGRFGYYNETSNTYTDLTTTDTGNWMHHLAEQYWSPEVNDIVIANNGLVYTAGSYYQYVEGGKIGVYNKTSNIWTDLRPTNQSFTLMSVPSILNLEYDSTNNIIYTIGDGWVGYYNITANTWNLLTTNSTCLSSTYDSTNNLIYCGGGSGIFKVYNITSSIWTDLTNKDFNNWFPYTVYTMSYSSIQDKVYTAGQGGLFGVYETGSIFTDGIWYNISNTDTDNWMGAHINEIVFFNSYNNLTYIGQTNGHFGYYNRTSNISTNISSSIMPLTYINAITESYYPDCIFIGGLGGWGIYNVTLNNYTALPMFSEDSVNAITYDSVKDLVYIGGTHGAFSRYNKTSGVLTDLTGTDTANWMGHNPGTVTPDVASLVYNSNNGLIYTSSANNGVYNFTSNVWTVSLTFDSYSKLFYNSTTNSLFSYGSYYNEYNSSISTWSNITSTYCSHTGWPANNVIYDSSLNGFFSVCTSGQFFFFDINSLTSTNLSTTDAGNWVGSTNGYSITHDALNNLFYTGLGSGLLGVYSITDVTNNLPSAPTGSTLTSSDIYVGDILTVTGAGSIDYENDTITYLYEFYNSVNNILKQNYSSDNHYTIQSSDESDTIRVRILASTIYGNSTNYEELTKDIMTSPTCGDGTCNGAETCSTCSSDCGACGGGGVTPPVENITTIVNTTNHTDEIGNPIIVVGTTNDTSWQMSAGAGSFSYDLSIVPGTSKTKDIWFLNTGLTERDITLTCEDISGTGCQYVTYSINNFKLPPVKGQSTKVPFTINIPENMIEEEFIFNIVATDDLDQPGVLSATIKVPQNFFLISIAKLLSNKNMFGINNFPYWIIYAIMVLFLWLFTFYLGLKKLKSGVAISFATSLLLSLIILGFI